MRQAALDILGLGGFGSVVYGVWLLSPPLAFIAGGALALGFVVAAAAQSKPKRGGP